MTIGTFGEFLLGLLVVTLALLAACLQSSTAVGL